MFINKHRKRKIYCMSLAVKRFSFLIIMSKKKINIKENFTFTKKTPQDEVTFK